MLPGHSLCPETGCHFELDAALLLLMQNNELSVLGKPRLTSTAQIDSVGTWICGIEISMAVSVHAGEVPGSSCGVSLASVSG